MLLAENRINMHIKHKYAVFYYSSSVICSYLKMVEMVEKVEINPVFR